MLKLILFYSCLQIFISKHLYQKPQDPKILQLKLTKIRDFYFVELPIGSNQKRTRLKLKTDSKNISIQCAKSNGFLRKVYNFLKKPFFQDYNYQCIDDNKQNVTDVFNLPVLGMLDVSFKQIRYHQDYGGELGLTKKSEFLNSLPTIYQKFAIYINTNQFNENQQSSLVLGGYNPNLVQGNLDKIPFDTKDLEHWALSLQNMIINGQKIEGGTAIINSTTNKIKVPNTQYNSIVKIFKKNLGCILTNDNKYEAIPIPNPPNLNPNPNKKQLLVCPCQNGQLSKFPFISITTTTSQTIKLLAQSYINIQQQICQILIEQSGSTKFQLGLPFFKDNIVYFQNQQSFSIVKAGEYHSSRQNLKSPFQIILNTSVIIILCLFISLILIQFFRRVSGFASAKQQSIHEIMLRTQGARQPQPPIPLQQQLNLHRDY